MFCRHVIFYISSFVFMMHLRDVCRLGICSFMFRYVFMCVHDQYLSFLAFFGGMLNVCLSIW